MENLVKDASEVMKDVKEIVGKLRESMAPEDGQGGIKKRHERSGRDDGKCQRCQCQSKTGVRR